MDSAEAVHRLHFAFTAAFHYLFPQLTMGLALLLVVLKVLALRTGDSLYDTAARFWARIFGIGFVMGVATGIPLEFQFGTNWAGLSKAAGGVLGQALAMEGVFAFFLESSFLGLFLFGEKRMSRKAHAAVAGLLLVGTWASGYFIVSANAWMQHPVGLERAADGTLSIASPWVLLTNPWAVWQYLHTMLGAVVTGSLAMAAVGAFYLLRGRHEEHGRAFVRIGTIAGLAASVLVLYPTGDVQGKNLAAHQPAALAAMEGLFETREGAPLVLIGQPDMERRRLDNPIEVPRALSFLTYHRWSAEVKGLDAFPPETHPQNVPLLYYAYHVMVGLGTIFIAVLALAAWMLFRGTLWRRRGMLGVLALSFPFPFIANTAGWMTAELGRQPWVVYGVLRTKDAYSSNVSAGNALFTLIGFLGVYAVLAALFLFLVGRQIGRGPDPRPGSA
jgi:cytochrome d ubiquinol oxidase subunit I